MDAFFTSELLFFSAIINFQAGCADAIINIRCFRLPLRSAATQFAMFLSAALPGTASPSHKEKDLFSRGELLGCSVIVCPHMGLTSLLNILNLPVYRRQSVCLQISICFGKRSAPEKASISRKRTGMRAFQNQMSGIGDHGCLLLCRPSPQDKYKRPVLPGKNADRGICKLLPSDIFM